MGNIGLLPWDASSNHKGKGKKKKKYYVPVYRRKESRFNPETADLLSATLDIQIDKYDFILVFPWTEVATFKESTKSFREFHFVTPDEKYRRPYISWLDIESLWRRASHGSSDEKDEAVKSLRNFMRERFDCQHSDEPNQHTLIYYHAWLTLAREAIVEKLCHMGGLQMKVTAKESHNRLFGSNGGKVLCRVRATNQRLEAMADKANYKLQLREEIDPGSENFWHVENENGVAIELEDEKIIYSYEEASDILRQLHRVGKVSAQELEIYSQVELPAMWSRRVHALERIADRIITYNRYPAYAPFTTQPHLRYVFKDYPAVRGKTLFRAKDRLYLGKMLVDSCFDLEAFKDTSHGFPSVLESFTPLHDSNRGESISIDWLFKMWVTFWRANNREVGVPCVTHPAYHDIDFLMDGDEDGYGGVWFYQRPFSQPLAQIRDYFGEKIALSFAWLGMYAYYLALPSILGILVEVAFIVQGYTDSVDSIDYYLEAFALCIVIWSSIFIRHWSTEQSFIAVKWGTDGFETSEADRPQFQGDADTPKLSYITNEPILYFSPEEKFWRMFWSAIAVTLVTLVDISMIGMMFYLEYIVVNVYPEYEFSYFSAVVALVQAMFIPISLYFFYGLVLFLNDAENHRTETQYDEALVTKVVAFQCFNCYGALLFTAFGKYYVFGTCNGTCISAFRTLLYAIFVVRGAELLLDMIRSIAGRFIYSLFYSTGEYAGTLGMGLGASAGGADAGAGGGSREESQPLLDHNSQANTVIPSTISQSELEFLGELDRSEFVDRYLFDMYADLAFQFGYVTFFSSAFPLLPVIALVETMLKLRLSAFKMCSVYRRPHVQLAEDIGHWMSLKSMFCILGAISNVAILIYTYEMFYEYSMVTKSLVFVCQEGLYVFIAWFILAFNVIRPAALQEIIARNKFICDKYLFGHDDYEVDMNLNDQESLDPTIDVDMLKLSGSFRGWTADELQESKQLRDHRRQLLHELRLAREALDAVSGDEVFNELSGVSQSVQEAGSAVGMLVVRIGAMGPIDLVKRREKLADCRLLRVKVSLRNHLAAEIVCAYSNLVREGKVSGVDSLWLEQEMLPFTGIASRLTTVHFQLVEYAKLPPEQVARERARELERRKTWESGKEEARKNAADEFLKMHSYDMLADFLDKYDEDKAREKIDELALERLIDNEFEFAASNPERIIVTASIDLNDPSFSDQVVGRKLILPLSFVNPANGQPTALSPASMDVTIGFQFSKLLQERQRVMRLQGELIVVEKRIAEHKVKSISSTKSKDKDS